MTLPHDRDGDWASLSALVVGFGREGFAAADNLLHLGARVHVVDSVAPTALAEQAELLGVLGADLAFGRGAVAGLSGTPDVVIDTGLPLETRVLRAAEAAHVPVWSQVELAWRLRGPDSPPWLGVAGPAVAGIVETTLVLESLLYAAGLATVRCGPGGVPVTEAVMDPAPYDVMTVGLTSRHLHRPTAMACFAGAVLPIGEPTEADVAWHGSAEALLAGLGRVYEGVESACVYQVTDARTEALVLEADVVEGARAVGVTPGTPGLSMIGVVEDVLADRAFIAARRDSAAELGTFADLGRDDPAYLTHVLTATALARAFGVSPGSVQAGLRALL